MASCRDYFTRALNSENPASALGSKALDFSGGRASDGTSCPQPPNAVNARTKSAPPGVAILRVMKVAKHGGEWSRAFLTLVSSKLEPPTIE